MSLVDGFDVLRVLRLRLASEGLHVVLPVGWAALDEIFVGAGWPGVNALLPGASGAVVIGDGGPAFFRRFQRDRERVAGNEARHPLDEYTRAQVSQAVIDVLTELPTPFRIFYPFDRGPNAIPFQRLGQIAGLPAPGPLGLQIHPTYGPWWAYRALLILSLPLTGEPSVGAPCADCPRPCVKACPAAAVTVGGFLIDPCVDHRLSGAECRESCVARSSCPVGGGHAYSDDQLAFHMKASLIQAIWHRRSSKVVDTFP